MERFGTIPGVAHARWLRLADASAQTARRWRVVTAKVVVGMQFAIDILAIVLAVLVASAYRGDSHDAVLGTVGVLLYACVILLAMRHLGYYRIEQLVRGPLASLRFSLLVVATLYVAAALVWFAPEAYGWLAVVMAVASVAMLLGRLLLTMLLRIGTRRGLLGERVVLLGSGRAAENFIRSTEAASPEGWWKIAAVGGDGRDQSSGTEALPALVNEIHQLVRADQVHHVVIALPWSGPLPFDEVRRQLAMLPVDTSFTWSWEPEPPQDSPFAAYRDDVDWRRFDVPLHRLSRQPSLGWGAIIKWWEDKLLGGLALILLSPVLIIVAVLIKLDSPGPVFFRQKRYGFNHKPIMVYKFRTMVHDPEGSRPFRQATKNDSRVTRIGRFLRRTSIDELPQLFNVLNGSMSLVGPRPHPVELDDRFAKIIEGFEGRHCIKPGITGWAQIHGFRGETDTLEKMQARVAYDVSYIENWSLWLDLKILAKTALGGWSDENAY